MADSRVHANDVVVTLPFVGEYHGLGQSDGANVVNQGSSIGMVDHAQTCLPALMVNRADNRRSVIVVSAVSKSFVGPSILVKVLEQPNLAYIVVK
jgi:hypothetical protein